RLASLELWNPQLRSHPHRRLFQSYLEVVTEIRSSLRRGSASARSAGGVKYIAETKQVAQDVFYAAEAGGAPRGIGGAARNSRMPETIVTLSPFSIRKHPIRFSSFLALLFCFGIALVLVDMVLILEPSTGPFY